MFCGSASYFVTFEELLEVAVGATKVGIQNESRDIPMMYPEDDARRTRLSGSRLLLYYLQE